MIDNFIVVFVDATIFLLDEQKYEEWYPALLIEIHNISPGL